MQRVGREAQQNTQSHVGEASCYLWCPMGLLLIFSFVGILQRTTRDDRQRTFIPPVQLWLSDAIGSRIVAPEFIGSNDCLWLHRACDFILSSACDLAAQSIKQTQVIYKKVYDKKSDPSRLQVGDWVLMRFPQEEVGKMWKLSRPWHWPYRIRSKEEPDVTVTFP